jgi:hypothetical protein
MQERGAALPATGSRTDRRQQLPRIRLKTSRPSAALLPSRPPLCGYKIRHDGRIAARIVQTAAYSKARHTTLPHVANWRGMHVIRSLLGL